ncbi:Uncharacterized protein TPAR_04672 [Tolypocladium paradoxum]|uniref:sphingolipid C(9)-methyltransferase n=1 Tax=Tolypocladium paradoxum TaxID=94208 RepID=A0A2S4KY86_9HYPO|nr:Uncharacterized protein TPAR_04672 [Tolypocladium paradoxum]
MISGPTIAENQRAWCNDVLRRAGVPEEQSRILYMDYGVRPRESTTRFRSSNNTWRRDIRAALWPEIDMAGPFLNKYICRGADASSPLRNYKRSLENAEFEVKSVDTVGVHYSATLWRRYRNWIWEPFLAWSAIASRQGSAMCFQILAVKNLHSTHRIGGVGSQYGLSGALATSEAAGKATLLK